MLNVFTLASGRLFQEEIDSAAALAPVEPVWVDLENPSPVEKSWIAGRFGLLIPDNIIDDDLEQAAVAAPMPRAASASTASSCRAGSPSRGPSEVSIWNRKHARSF